MRTVVRCNSSRSMAVSVVLILSEVEGHTGSRPRHRRRLSISGPRFPHTLSAGMTPLGEPIGLIARELATHLPHLSKMQFKLSLPYRHIYLDLQIKMLLSCHNI